MVYPEGWRAPRPYMRFVPQPGTKKSVHYKKAGIATFDATPDKIFKYMSAGNHKHQAFKSHRLVGVSGNVVTIESEIYNPDGSTHKTTIMHKLSPPIGVETTMTADRSTAPDSSTRIAPLTGRRRSIWKGTSRRSRECPKPRS